MTDQTSTTPAEDEFFDSATSEFPAKEDLKDRLVAIWFTGKTGTRQSEGTGKPYPFAESVTLVLDDGPNGWNPVRWDGEANLVPSVAEDGPQTLTGFEWSAKGLHDRLVKRPVGGKPMCGRINSRKNKIKGFNDSWSIDELTESDRVTVRQYVHLFPEIANGLQKSQDDEAFS